MISRRRLGAYSLATCILGFAVCETALALGWIAHPAWRVVAAGFEAGTIGGLADWFAVSALFRRVPIPLISRHTDIIRRNRTRITAAIVDLVQNRWLSPAAVRAKIAGFSLVDALARGVERDAGGERLAKLCSSLLTPFAPHLASPAVVAVVTGALARELPRLDLARPLGEWLAGRIADGSHHRLWGAGLDLVEASLADDAVVDVLAQHIETAARSYKDQGWMKRLFVGGAEKLGAVDYGDAARVLLARARELAGEARGDAAHPLRVRIDATLVGFATRLRDGDAEAVALVRSFQERIAASPRLAGAVEMAMAALGRAAADTGPDGALVRAAIGLARAGIADLARKPEAGAALDGVFRDAVAGIVERNHAFIGDIVRDSLDPAKLSDEELIQQVEDKVGDDLQYIRLNGAVVGGLVGVLIAVVRWWVAGSAG